MQSLWQNANLKQQILLLSYLGHCLEASFGKIIQYNCKNFLSGCPNETFFEYGFYKCK